MNTLQINIPAFYGTRKMKFTAPDEFNKLTRKQLLKIARLIFSNLDEITKKTVATKVLYQLKWWHVFLFTPAQMAYMNTFCTWLFDGKHYLTDNKILKIKTGIFKKPLYGPIGDFETLKGNEWTSADTAFMEYIETQNEHHLDNLIAILWRPKSKVNTKSEDYDNDLRVPYNPHTVEKRAKQIFNLSPAVKYAILLWYRGCRQEWADMFDRVFTSETKEQVESYGWAETIQKVSGKLFGDLSKTEDTHMHKILLNMQIEIKDHEYWESKNQTKQ